MLGKTQEGEVTRVPKPLVRLPAQDLNPENRVACGAQQMR